MIHCKKFRFLVAHIPVKACFHILSSTW
jgi:hypothetical protein